MKKITLLGLLFTLVCATQGTVSNAQKNKDTEEQKRAKSFYIQATSFYQQGKYLEAARFYRSAIKTDSTFVESYIGLGNSYLGLGKPDSAYVVFKKVVEKFSKDSRGYEGLGYFYGFYKKDCDKGKKYYLHALSLSPEDKQILFNLARLAEECSAQEADSLYRSLLEIYPEHKGIIKRYFVFLIEQKKFLRAIELSSKVEEFFSDDPEAVEKLTELYLETKNYQKALTYLSKTIGNNSQKAELYIQRGDLYQKLNNTKAAVNDYNKAIQIKPKQPLAYIRKANLYLKTGNYSEARNIALKILDFDFPSLDMKAAAYSIIADSYYKIGEIYRNRYEESKVKKERDTAIEQFKNAILWYKKTRNLGKSIYYNYADTQIKRAEIEIKKLLGIHP